MRLYTYVKMHILDVSTYVYMYTYEIIPNHHTQTFLGLYVFHELTHLRLLVRHFWKCVIVV